MSKIFFKTFLREEHIRKINQKIINGEGLSVPELSELILHNQTIINDKLNKILEK